MSSRARARLSPKTSTALFFKHNTSLGPPYQILIDTNFINFSITNKLDIFKSLMDCLLAKCVPIITDCPWGRDEEERQPALDCRTRAADDDGCLFSSFFPSVQA